MVSGENSVKRILNALRGASIPLHNLYLSKMGKVKVSAIGWNFPKNQDCSHVFGLDASASPHFRHTARKEGVSLGALLEVWPHSFAAATEVIVLRVASTELHVTCKVVRLSVAPHDQGRRPGRGYLRLVNRGGEIGDIITGGIFRDGPVGEMILVSSAKAPGTQVKVPIVNARHRLSPSATTRTSPLSVTWHEQTERTSILSYDFIDTAEVPPMFER